MIGWIVSWIVISEILYFGIFREELNANWGIGEFFGAKLVSILSACLLGIILIGIPWMIKEQEGYTYLQTFGWYYGAILSVLIFFRINWKITKYLDNKNENIKRY